MQPKIRVIYFLPCFGIGGTERVVLDLCRNVSRDRFDIEVCTMVGGLFADQAAASGVPVHLLAPASTKQKSIFAKVVNYFRMLSSLRAIIGRGGPVVLHTHHYGPLMQAFLIRKLTSQKFGWLHTEHSWTDVLNAYAIRLYKLLNPMQSADVISGVADKVTSYMQEVSGIIPAHAVTVLNGIETGRFNLEVCAIKRRELGFGPEDIVIGTVGMLRPEKNQQLAIRAFALIAPEFPKLHFVVCGEGECRPGLQQLAVNLGIAERVNFLGYRMDAHEIMATFDIYCLPSVYEGLPLSILEAWAARKPVVATAVIGNVDIVHHEVNGLLVPLNEEQIMADALKRLVLDPALGHRLADNGHGVVMDYFDVKRMVNRYVQIYEDIAC